MNTHQTSDITQAVLDRLAADADPRFRQIITAVVRHAHALAREVDLKPDEWMAAIQFLTRVGQTCDDKRQEFILLSDTLGISMLVVQLEQARRSARALADKTASVPPTEATVQGPFYWEGAPVLPLGSDIGQGMPGEPAYYSGRVTDTHGQAARALLRRRVVGRRRGRVRHADGRRRRHATARALPHRRRGSLPLLVDQADLLPGARRRPGGRHAARAWAGTPTGRATST